jgi:hypothetical protein
MKYFRGAAGAVGFLLCSCASTTIQSISYTPDFNSSRIHKVLIVSLTSTPEIRKLSENEFVRQWKERGVEAVASSSVLPSDVTLDKAGVAPFAKAQGYDTVLVNRLMSRQEIDKNIRVHQIGDTAPQDSQNMTQYFQAVVASPEYPIDYQVAVLTTNLYDAATEMKIWSGVSQTLVTGDVSRKIGPFTKTILKSIYQKS